MSFNGKAYIPQSILENMTGFAAPIPVTLPDGTVVDGIITVTKEDTSFHHVRGHIREHAEVQLEFDIPSENLSLYASDLMGISIVQVPAKEKLDDKDS